MINSVKVRLVRRSTWTPKPILFPVWLVAQREIQVFTSEHWALSPPPPPPLDLPLEVLWCLLNLRIPAPLPSTSPTLRSALSSYYSFILSFSWLHGFPIHPLCSSQLSLFFFNYILLIWLLRLSQFFPFCPNYPACLPPSPPPTLLQAIPPPLFMVVGDEYKFFGYPISSTVLYTPMATL